MDNHSVRNSIAVARPDQIHLEALPYKYPMRTAVTLEAEIRQIETCMKQGYPRITIHPIKDEWISIVGFGPSLEDTWKEITHPCITVSGAHDFLIERWITPDYHAECDGRDHKTKHLEHPNPKTTYLMASICNPLMWKQLEGCKVEYWHNANGMHVVDWIGKNDVGGIMLAGGSVIGLTAIHLAGLLGYRKFKLFGFDGNFRGEKRHAGKHFGPPQKTIQKGKWNTTPQMFNACEEFFWLRRDCPELQFEIYGDCLLKDMAG